MNETLIMPQKESYFILGILVGIVIFDSLLLLLLLLLLFLAIVVVVVVVVNSAGFFNA